MFIFRGNSRIFRVSAVLLKGSKTGFVCKFSYFFGSTYSMFIFRGNSHTFRNGVPRAFLTFLALQHPAQELKSSFRGNFRCSVTSGPRTAFECARSFSYFCGGVVVFLW